MWRHIGACRYIWNYMLYYQKKNYESGGKHLSAFDMEKLLKPLKNDGEHNWLCDISSYSLDITCHDLNNAYSSFFKKISGFPKFKSRKRSKPVFPVRAGRLWFSKDKVNIEKIGKIRYKTDFDIPLNRGQKFSNSRISCICGKWILSFGMECENQTFELTDKSMGIDLGVKDLAVVVCGEDKIVFHNINKSKKIRNLKRKMKHQQRTISRKYEANRTGNRYYKTRNIERAEANLRKIHARINNIRSNYIHQCTHLLVAMLPYRVVMENLNVSGMMKNRHLSKAIQEQGFYEFTRQMKYKCEWRGIEFIQVDRFYPSSKTCSCCGNLKKDLKLKDRTYVCENCGFIIDRDYNAAINLMRYPV